MRSRRRRSSWILLAIAALLLVVAVVSVGLFLLLRQQPQESISWQDPVAAVAIDEISPDWALWPLAGALELETIDRALAGGDLEAAYAILVFDVALTDAQRIGRLNLLAQRFMESGKQERAALCYQQVYDIAVLSPALSTPTRTDALLATGLGWTHLERWDLARNAYDQVYTMAVRDPYLQVAHRRDLLHLLETGYRDLGDMDRIELCREQLKELDKIPVRSSPVRGESLDLPVVGEPVSSPEVGELEEVRRQEAFALLETLSDGSEASADQVERLARALLAEDVAKLGLYSQELEQATQLTARINVHWHLIRWLTLKYQVAMKGLGISLVPDWEAQVADIQSALSKAYEDLLFDYEDLVTALPEASLMEPGSYKVRRLVTLSGRLGQYPNFGEQKMAGKLSDAVTNLISAGSVDQLYVDSVPEGEGLRFFFSTAGEYGQPLPSP